MYLRGNLGGWYLVYCSQSKIGVKFASLFINIAFTFTFFWFTESKLRSIDCCTITLLFPALFRIWSMLKLLDRIIISAFRGDSELLTKRYWLESVIFRSLFSMSSSNRVSSRTKWSQANVVVEAKCFFSTAKHRKIELQVWMTTYILHDWTSFACAGLYLCPYLCTLHTQK